MSLRHYTTAKCDHCGRASKPIRGGDGLNACRVLRQRGWQVVRYDFYGNTGHYCKRTECQEEAGKLEYKE